MAMERIILWIVLGFCGFCIWLLVRRDFLRWTRPIREAQAIVVGQASGWSDGVRTQAARLRFEADGKVHEITDQLYGSRPALSEGTICRVTWPEGRPDLARIPRPGVWLGVYAVLLYPAGIVVGRLTGFLD